jgi:hypothetical protein
MSISEGTRLQAFEVPLVTVRQAELLKEVVLSCQRLGASAVRRSFWAAALVLGLVLVLRCLENVKIDMGSISVGFRGRVLELMSFLRRGGLFPDSFYPFHSVEVFVV